MDLSYYFCLCNNAICAYYLKGQQNMIVLFTLLMIHLSSTPMLLHEPSVTPVSLQFLQDQVSNIQLVIVLVISELISTFIFQIQKCPFLLHSQILKLYLCTVQFKLYNNSFVRPSFMHFQLYEINLQILYCICCPYKQ